MRLVMLSNEPEASAVLPAIAFLEHQVQVLPPQPDSYGALENADVVMVDAPHGSVAGAAPMPTAGHLHGLYGAGCN